MAIWICSLAAKQPYLSELEFCRLFKTKTERAPTQLELGTFKEAQEDHRTR